MIWAKSDKSSSLGEICDDHNGQINLRAKQKYKILSAYKSVYSTASANWANIVKFQKYFVSTEYKEVFMNPY